MRAAVFLFVLLLCSGCTAIVSDEIGDLERSTSSQRDLHIRLVGFDPHVGQLVDIQVVDPADDPDPDRIQARAVIQTLPSSCVDIRMRRGAPVSANRIDFYADLNMNGMLDPMDPMDPMTIDHAWRCDDSLETPCQLDGDELIFAHNFMFHDIAADPASPIGGAFDITISGLEEHDGKSVTGQLLTEITVDMMGTTETGVPALFFISSVSGGAFDVVVPGIVDGGLGYDLELTIGDDELICTLPDQIAPGGGDFTIDAPLSSFTCAPPAAVDCAALETQCDARDAAACETLARRCAFVDCAR